MAVTGDTQGLLEIIRVKLEARAVGNWAIKEGDTVHATGLAQDRTNPTNNPHPCMWLNHLSKLILRLYFTEARNFSDSLN